MNYVDKIHSIDKLQKEIEVKENELAILKNRLKEETNGLIRCNKCHTWLHPDNLAVGSYKETNTETTYTDAGYGDDDRIGEVTRLITVSRCLKCGHEIHKKSITLDIQNERRRR